MDFNISMSDQSDDLLLTLEDTYVALYSCWQAFRNRAPIDKYEYHIGYLSRVVFCFQCKCIPTGSLEIPAPKHSGGVTGAGYRRRLHCIKLV